MKSEVLIESLIGIFTVEEGNIKILLARKKNEPYKGYWVLPGKDLGVNDTLENNITDVVIEQAGLSNISVKQCHVFSGLDRSVDKRKVAVTFIGLIDSMTVKLKAVDTTTELDWFDINNLPKTGFDHDEIIEYMTETISEKITSLETIKILFPSDFTIPELQKTYENLLSTNLDRRNFRKKLFDLDVIEDTGYTNEGGLGRPAKLYKFKETNREIELF